MQFDAQVGNPPYNPNKEKKKEGHITANLWSKFVDHAYTHLKDGGHMVYVHPPLWRKPENSTLKKLCVGNSIKYIRIFDQQESKKVLKFPVKVDYYHLQKKVSENCNTIVSAKGKEHSVEVCKLPFIPNDNFGDVYSMFSDKAETNIYYGCEYHHYTQNKTGRVSPTETQTHKYKVLYLSSKDGYTYHYSNVKLSPHFDCPKIIVPMGRFDPILDLNGEIGMCEVAFGILGEKEYLENVFKAMKNPKFASVLSSCKWKVMQLDYKLFKYLKKDFWKQLV